MEVSDSIRAFLSTAWRGRGRYNTNIFIQTKNIYFTYWDYETIDNIYLLGMKYIFKINICPLTLLNTYIKYEVVFFYF